MDAAVDQSLLKSDFRPQATFWVAILALVLVAPFAIYSAFQARLDVTISAIAVTIMLSVIVWNASREPYRPIVTLLTLVPSLAIFHAISLHNLGVIGLLWCFPAILTLYCMLPQRWAWGANITLLTIIIPIMFLSIDTNIAMRGLVTLTTVSLFPAILVRVIAQQHEALHSAAFTDSLTGLFNRRALNPALQRTIDQARLLNTPVSLQILDLDHFKRINDEHGHDAGDDVLSGLGLLLRNHLRQGDSAFRLGGEEFLILLNGASVNDAQRLAETLRDAISDASLLPGGEVTASFGIAELSTNDTEWRTWMHRADTALYKAKHNGRNQIVCGE